MREVVKVNNKLMFLLLMVAILPIASAAQEVVISTSSTVDSTFKVGLSLNETANFNGAEFNVEGATITSVSFPVSGVDAITEISSENVLIAVPNAISTRTFAELMLTVSGSGGQEKTFTIENIELSIDNELGESILINVEDVSQTVELSECVSYSNSHASTDGTKLFNVNCYCDEGYIPTIDIYASAPKCVLESEATSIYGNLSTSCVEGLDPIVDTGFCCIEGYEFAFENNIADIFGKREEACIPRVNNRPTAKISQPDDEEEQKAGSRIYFKANATDSDGQIEAYLWDFGDRSKPWGYLIINSKDEIVCKKRSGTTSCDEDAAIVLADYEEDENIPCTCDIDKYPIEILNIYPDAASTKQKAIHTYSNKYVCTPYDEDETVDCEVTLWVYDDDNDFGKTKIDIELEGKSSDDDSDNSDVTLFCGDGLVTGTEVCDGLEVDGCASGICNSDCTCEKPVGTDIELDTPSTSPTAATCGNNRCETGENTATCFTDCHCGDNVCQDAVESKSSCPSDCKSGSMGIILVIIILAAAGIIFVLYKRGFDFTKYLPSSLSGGFGKGRSKSFGSSGNSSSKSSSPLPPSSPTSKMETYIKQTRKKGYSYTQIKEELRQKGWHEDQINDVFSRVGMP
jgi:hypothetical protein